MSSDSYVKASIKTVGLWLIEEYKQLTLVAKTPLTSGYQPDLDVLDILGPESANWFQNIIGILNWIVDVGRVDINNSVEQLSNSLANARAVHLWAALHVFSYLNHYDRYKLFFCPSMSQDSGNFNEGKNWQYYYPDAEDELPPNMPDPMGLLVQITCFLRVDHAGDHVTRP